jgi:hypothetical protein
MLYALNPDGDTISTSTNPPFNGTILRHKPNIYTFLGDGTFTANQDSIHLFRTKAHSGLLWQRSYFWGTCNNSATDQVESFTSSTLFTGIYSFTNCNNPVYNSFYALTDQNGNNLWTHFIKGTENDQIHAAEVTPDNGFALAGWTDSRGAGLADFLLVKTNASGDTLWSKTYGDTKANNCYSLAIAPDSGFYMLGYDDSVRLIKTDEQGSKEWVKVLGEACGGSDFAIKQSQDQGYTALTLEQINGTCRSVLYKLKADGSVFWRKVFQTGRLTTYQERSDTSYVLAGYVYDTATFQSDILVTGFDSTTNTEQTGISLNETLTSAQPQLTIQPNPVLKRTIIHVQNKSKPIKEVTIYSWQGEQVRYIKGHGRRQIRVDKKNLSGIYLISTKTTEGEQFSAKVVFR